METSKCINEPASLPILLKGHVRCRMPATARFASSSAVASTSSSSGGFYSWLTGEQSTSSPSLDFPLPDLLERMAFRSTRDRSHLRVVRDMKAISKPHLLGSRWGAPLLLWKLMSLKWLSFLLMFAELCFSGFGACYSVVLANPLLAPECAISRLNSTLIKEFFAENYTAPWMVLAASRVEHDQLMLLGGGGSFSAGGPGKGVYSRLHRCVLNEIPHVQPFSAFSNIYNHPGIFGIQGTTGYDSVPKSIDLAGREFTSMA
ncbi:mitochondrial processing peptidase [Citrus sinensis]|nr:mitochondrial processing peptidase [Citrus sinensis]